jgi:hypothetical protein
MADSGESFEGTGAYEGGDVSMIGEEAVVIEIDSAAPAGEDAGDNLALAEEAMDVEPAQARTTYIDYLKSHIITLLVGQGDEQALLTAHQALLVTSPWFKEACDRFTNDIEISVRRRQMTIMNA